MREREGGNEGVSEGVCGCRRDEGGREGESDGVRELGSEGMKK